MLPLSRRRNKINYIILISDVFFQRFPHLPSLFKKSYKVVLFILDSNGSKYQVLLSSFSPSWEVAFPLRVGVSKRTTDYTDSHIPKFGISWYTLLAYLKLFTLFLYGYKLLGLLKPGRDTLAKAVNMNILMKRIRPALITWQNVYRMLPRKS